MGTVKAYRPDVDDVTGSTVCIVKAAHGGTAGRPAYMSLMRVSVTSLPATQKRPQVDTLHRHLAVGVRCGDLGHRLSKDSKAASTTEHKSKAIKRRSCRPAPTRGINSGCSGTPEQEKR